MPCQPEITDIGRHASQVPRSPTAVEPSAVGQESAAVRGGFSCRAILLAGLLALSACAHEPPPGTAPVTGFELSRYLGRWIEIARLDHSFERGLTRVSATYQRRTDGGVNVVNRGFDAATGQWREATGKAYFVGSPRVASLRVSFFGPFYGGYHVVDLDRSGYRWALVVGPSRDYLWILAREPTLPAHTREHLLMQIRKLGVDPAKLIWVEQTGPG
ncbi:MAG: lipocalin family protein [Quisquiliibacterium sp.]